MKDANFKLAWMRPHSGNYDVQEAYAWLASVLAKAGRPKAARSTAVMRRGGPALQAR